MRNYNSKLMLYFVIWAALSVFCVQTAEAVTFYVSPQGNDGWSGRLAQPNKERTDGPLASLTSARDAVRRLKSQGPLTEPAHVKIADGSYVLSEPIVFTPADSGTEKCPIIYEALPGDKPVFSGGRVIKGFKRSENGIWQTHIPEVAVGKWYFKQLFVNGRRAVRARTPNKGYLRTDGPLPEIKEPQKERENLNAKMGFRYKAGDLKKWDNFEDVNLFIYHSWTASLNWIASLDEENRIVRFTAPSNWPIGYWERKQRYYVENHREALDTPGEWYLERKTGMLYYWPTEEEDINQVVVEAPVLRKLVLFNGDYQSGKFVTHIFLRGLSFQHANWFVKDKGRADGQAAAWLEAAVFAQGTQHCELDGCEIAHVGEYGVYFERGCKNNRIVRCHIHDLGAGGVRIGHISSPKDNNEATEYNVIDNCFIHDGGHIFRAGIGVWVGRSSYNTITNNDICNFDYTGFSVGWSWGYAPSSAHHNLIEYNHVYNIGRGVLSDMGGIYTLGASPGTVVRNNIFHDIYSYSYGGWGLYTDEGSTGIVMENNLVYNTKTGGFHQHYGKENIIRNNIFGFALEAQVMRTREEDHLSFTFERNIIIFESGKFLGSNWTNDRFKMDYNCYWNTSGKGFDFAGASFEEWQARGHDQNSLIADPCFVAAGARDFRLHHTSPAIIKLGFKPFDYNKAGVYGDPDWVNLAKGVKFPPVEFALEPRSFELTKN